MLSSLIKPMIVLSVTPHFPRVLHRLTLAVLLVLTLCPRLYAIDPVCDAKPVQPPPEAGQPPNVDGLKAQLRYYKCSGEYDREFRKVIDTAISYVDMRAKEERKSDNGSAKLAIVLDIDETSLSNWAEIQANDFGFILDGICTLKKGHPCGDGAWKLLADASALDTLRLFKVAKENNVHVFFVSARKEEIRAATAANLRKAGYTDWADPDLVLQQCDDDAAVQQYKTAKRREIENHLGYNIIANVGDQYSDLKGGFAERVFKVPNPFYFIPDAQAGKCTSPSAFVKPETR